MHECVYQIHLFQGHFFQICYNNVWKWDTVSEQDLEPLQQNAVQIYEICHLPYLLSRRLVEENIKARNKETDLDPNPGLC